jgi:hypothetical protein
MHTLIVEFELRAIGTSEYEAHCDEIAPAFAEIPGLLSKLWILDRDSGRAGGVHLGRLPVLRCLSGGSDLPGSPGQPGPRQRPSPSLRRARAADRRHVRPGRFYRGVGGPVIRI